MSPEAQRAHLEAKANLASVLLIEGLDGLQAIDRQATQIRLLSAELTKMRNSTSWKVSAPVRWAARLVHRLSRRSAP